MADKPDSSRATLAPSPVERTEELRFALVMNGGVSLAVWMGGVSFEINRLVRETHPMWRGLLELTRTHARVDVISGTSAGGVNGAALALAQTYDRSLDMLREVWMEKGAFARLLRSPGEADPSSLLDGNGFYLPALQEAFATLASDPGWRVPAHIAPMRLSLTATLLRGERKVIIDDLGAAMEDASHRVQFKFTRSSSQDGAGTVDQDAFATPGHIALLARAARTSSSFPIAFEPVFWQQKDLEPHAGAELTMTGSRYLVDGGIVDNKPFEGALEAIFHMPAQGNVRRVLAYIAPDPSVSAASAEDLADEPPTLAEVAGSSLVGIPAAESISDQLERIQQHNRAIDRRRDALVGLARYRTPEELAQLARDLFPVYRYRRVHGLVDYLLQRLEVIVHPRKGDGQGASRDTRIGRKTLSWLRAVLEQDDTWVNERIPQSAAALVVRQGHWEWGNYSLNFLIELLFELLRRVQRLRYLTAGGRQDIPRLTPWPEQVGSDWERLDDRRTWGGDPPRAGVQPDTELGPLWQRAFAIRADMETAQSRDRMRVDAWAHHAQQCVAGGQAEAADPAALQAGLRAQAAAVLRLEEQPAGSVPMHQHAWNIALAMNALAAPCEAVIAAARERTLAPTERQACDDLAHLVRALRIGAQVEPQVVLQAALCFEVIHYSMSHRERGPNALVELVQISANSKSPLGGEELAVNKLAGMQLAHFGAFYKSSWRANDWMMGRLDAIGRLLAVVVNPERLYRLYAGLSRDGQPTSRWVADIIAGLAVEAASPAVREHLQGHIDRDALANELQFLDREGSRVPETLPACCALLTLRAHLEIVHREIPHVARCARDDETLGANPQGAASQLANQVLGQEGVGGAHDIGLPQAIELFTRKRVGAERLRDEVGSDLFTRSVAQTVAITHAAAAGEASGLALFARGFLKLLELPVMLFYWLAGRMVSGSRTSAAIGTAAMAVAVTMVILPFMLPAGALKDIESATRFSWILLGVCVSVLALRSVWVVLALVLAMLVPLATQWLVPAYTAWVCVLMVLATWVLLAAAGVRGIGVLLLLLTGALLLLPAESALPALAAAMGVPDALFGLDSPQFLSWGQPSPLPARLLPTLGLVYSLFFTVAANIAHGRLRALLSRFRFRLRRR